MAPGEKGVANKHQALLLQKVSPFASTKSWGWRALHHPHIHSPEPSWTAHTHTHIPRAPLGASADKELEIPAGEQSQLGEHWPGMQRG